MQARALLGALVVAACGGSDPGPEVVIAGASLGGTTPVVVGASAATVWWTASPAAGTTLVGAASLATLPATGMHVASATGPVAAAGDHALLVGADGLARLDAAGVARRISPVMPDAVGLGREDTPLLAWSQGATITWGRDDAQGSMTLNKVDRCDHLRASGEQIYVAADGASGRRLLRIDGGSATVAPGTASSTWAPMFPGGGMTGATYLGRIVDATDAGALWLVEEMPSRRGLVVEVPRAGDPVMLLANIQDAAAMFATVDTIYWQEGDELLRAPRSGGAASIVATLPGAAGAVVDGFVYYAHGADIERLRVE